MKPQFLLDEHLSRAIQEQLREMHVRLIGDADVPPLGTPDPDILMWVERNNHILVTNKARIYHISQVLELPKRSATFRKGSVFRIYFLINILRVAVKSPAVSR